MVCLVEGLAFAEEGSAVLGELGALRDGLRDVKQDASFCGEVEVGVEGQGADDKAPFEVLVLKGGDHERSRVAVRPV